MSVMVVEKKALTAPRGIRTEDVKKLRQNGFTIAEIASLLDISAGTVSYHLAKKAEEAVVPATTHATVSARAKRLPLQSEVIEQMRRLRENGFTNREIAEKVGCAYNTVVEKIGPQPKEMTLESIRRSGLARRTKDSVRKEAAVIPSVNQQEMTKDIAMNVLRFLAEVINQALNNV